MSNQFFIPRRTILVLIVLLLVAAGILVAYIYLPRAVITVHPATVTKDGSQAILLSASAKEPDFVRFMLPATIVRKEVPIEKSIERTNAQAHEDFAHGEVTLYNDQEDTQSLLPKSHLKHENGAFFLTDKPVRIPPHGTVAVSVTAEAKGLIGNVPAGKFAVDRLPAPTQKVVYGTSDIGFTGGSVVDTALTEEEIKAAVDAAVNGAKEEASKALASAAGGAPIRPDLINIEVTSAQASAPAGSFASSFSVKAVVTASAFIVDQNDLLGLTLLSLRSQTQEDEEFVSYEPQSFVLKFTAADFTRGEARVSGSLKGLYAKKISTSLIDPASLAGLATSEIQEELKKIPSIGQVAVDFSPFWVRTAPARAGAITIVVEDNKQK